MTGVLDAFGTIGVLIGAGALLAHLGIVDLGVQRALSTVVFWVAVPALLVGVVGAADLGDIVSGAALAQLLAVVVASLLVAVPARLILRRDLVSTTVAASLVGFVNAINLGLPLAIFALDDPTVVVPMVLIQLVLVQPLMITVLEVSRARRGGAGESREQGRGADAAKARGAGPVRAALQTLANPMLLGTAVGIVLSATGWELPTTIDTPLSMLGDMTIPAILVAFGISLRLGPRIGEGGWAEVAWITVVKLVLMPAVGVGVALALGLDRTATLGVAVVCALPAAQNIFVIAGEYGRGEQLARDGIVVTTVLSFPAILGIAAVLG
ncbi:AEC family transporter [Georgenia sp. Z1344]|uniref:AEC family transporter n=1 Tax=Georgenia sp. Z1344 TaxID=3416706 RepID=UPI003CEB224C